VRERSRRRILDAARLIVAEHGLDALKMRTLSERADVSVQTVYNLFGTKREVITALVTDELSRLDSAIAGLTIDDPIDRMRQQVELLVDSAINHTTRPLALVVLDDAIFTEQANAEWQSQSSIEHRIAAAMNTGDLSDTCPPGTLAEHFRSAMLHNMRLWACGVLTDEALRARLLDTLAITLLAVATDATRPRLAELLRHTANT
jgi:AcrR family transcriptional regulator